ncbi:MAG: methionine--tRNA ligase [Pseudomonas sp.]|jgi:methionyl-tRNA synthetase|uniref:methionine--tRNA ligase n=1 Tax=Pseudomonas sp. TaxID=306 RepID=UPI0023951736|nr:methionine--tRNA ligase [Pseudomonas sp.]MDE1198293.1 methionine--tRNA ligase [Pseudomonas sp.]
MGKLLVTITPPTPNGDLHIGHMAGPFLAADIYTRAQRQRGHDATLVSYSDDYQSYMLRRGIELDRAPQELALENTDKINDTLKKMGIEVDFWMRPYRNNYFKKAVEEMYEFAVKAGAIYKKVSQEPYCEHCDKWGYEAFGRGNCDHCGSDSDASQCEECAHTPNASKMSNFRCKLCSAQMIWRPVEREFLALSNFRSHLKASFEHTPLRPFIRRFLNEEFELGPVDWGITRPHDGGLDLKPDGSRRIHTWVMGLSGYLGAFREYLNEHKHAPWEYDEYCRSGKGRLVHFLGYDCAFSHMMVYPALLQTMHGYRMRQTFYTNQFLTLNGKNLSTSRNYAIWARDLVADACTDSARFYLALIAPEQDTDDFDVEKFAAWRKETFSEVLVKLAAQAERERVDGDSLKLTSADAAAIKILVARWFEVTSVDHFTMKGLAVLLSDVINAARDRQLLGKRILPYMALIGAIGAPVFPDLARQILRYCRFTENEVFHQLVYVSAVEYEI